MDRLPVENNLNDREYIPSLIENKQSQNEYTPGAEPSIQEEKEKARTIGSRYFDYNQNSQNPKEKDVHFRADNRDSNICSSASSKNFANKESSDSLSNTKDGEVLNCKLDHVKSENKSNYVNTDIPLIDRFLGSRNESEVEICGTKCHALIDTGSMVTTMSQRFYDSLSTKPELLSLDIFQLDVRVAGGSILACSGYIEAEVRIPFLHDKTMAVPVLVVPDMQYSGQIPIITGTNVIRTCKALSCNLSDTSVPQAWDSAFEALQNNMVGVVKSTNQRTITVKPMESKTITGFVRNCKARDAVTEAGDFGLSGSLNICPRVVSIKGNQHYSKIPVKVFNISARTLKIEPRSHLCELHEV